ncbi:MAG: hypothetical protein HPY52_16925 [Firmicutes bacterium]|nr:hypothetical protein [Bacillota bacterium]
MKLLGQVKDEAGGYTSGASTLSSRAGLVVVLLGEHEQRAVLVVVLAVPHSGIVKQMFSWYDLVRRCPDAQ